MGGRNEEVAQRAKMTTYFDEPYILADRIYQAIPEHPEILSLNSSFGLFKIKGLCDGLNNLTLATASGALARARQRYLQEHSDASRS